jgi:hypothetical protein
MFIFGFFFRHCNNSQRNFKIIPQRNIVKGMVPQSSMPVLSVEQQLWRSSKAADIIGLWLHRPKSTSSRNAILIFGKNMFRVWRQTQNGAPR